MIKREIWEAACDELIAEGRTRLGDPPATETLIAGLLGELDAAESARVREFLVYHPELARELLARQAPPGRPRPARATWLGGWRGGWRLAAVSGFALACLCGVLAFDSQLQVRRLARELAAPRVNLEHRLLLPDGVRDAAGDEAPILLTSTADHYLLTPTLTVLSSYPDYRLQIRELAGPRADVVWSADGLRPEGNSFTIWMPRAFLRPGFRHRLEISGLRGGVPTPLASYTLALQR